MAFLEITSLSQLCKNLNMGAGYNGYSDMLQSVNLPKIEWEKYCSWKDNRYTRNCIASCEDSYELLLLCWKKNQESPVHNFLFQESWFTVLEGELTIEYYEVDRNEKCGHKLESTTLKKGESIYLNDEMGFHKVINTNSENTISLHLNVAPVKQWEVFRSCRQALITVSPLLDTKSDECD